jgi:hypothetical protein
VFLGAFAVVVLFVFLGAFAVVVPFVSLQLDSASVSPCRLVCFVCFVALCEH